MLSQPELAGELLKEAEIIHYTKGKGGTTRTASQIIAEAETIPEANLGVNLSGVPAAEREQEAARYLPLVTRGLILYLNRVGEIQQIASRHEKSVREAKERIKEYEKYEKERKDREEARQTAKDEIKEALKQHNVEVEEKAKEEREAIKKEVEQKLAADNPYRVLRIDEKATQAEIDHAYREEILLRDREGAELEMRIAGYSEEEIEAKLKELDYQIAEIDKARANLKGDKRADTDAHLQGIRDLQKEPEEEGFVIKFIPSGNVKDKERTLALKNTEKLRDNVQYGYGAEFDHQYIENLKKSGFIPQNYTDQEANDTLNIAALVYSKVGDASKFKAGIDANPDLTPEERQKLQIIANNVEALKVSNPIASNNLHIASGKATVQITKGNIYDVRDDDSQIALKINGNTHANAFTKIKIEGSKIFNKDFFSFLEKSLNSKAAKKQMARIEQLGFNTAADTALGFLKAIPGIGWALFRIAKGTLMVLNKLFGRIFLSAYKAIAGWVNDNKEFVAISGTAMTIGGIVTGSLPMFVTGMSFLGSLLVAGSPIAITVATWVGVAFSVTAVVGTSLAYIAWVVLCFVLLVIFTVYIINTSGYVVPISYESGLVGMTPADCLGGPPPKPPAQGVRFSEDGDYAYPVAPFQVPGYSCYHWDGNKAADIFSPTSRVPLVAYENARVENVTLDDPLGGKYIILEGLTSGRFYYYAHNCHVFVTQGQTVNVGEVIATMDETGNGRVQHSHFAINSSSLFYGGDGNTCPQEDFEEKFKFGVCTEFCNRSS